MNDTLQLIQKSATERFNLYILAGHQQLTPAEKQRIDELNAQIPMLWHQHRTEVAMQHYSPNRGASRVTDVVTEAA
jgi:hypothetical protein